MDIGMISVIGAALSIMVGATVAALMMGKIGKAALEGMTRQPEVAGTLFTSMLITCALIEALCIYTLLVAILLIMANPMVK